VDYNEQQQLAVKMAGFDGKSCCIIGSAGTGKTTVMNGVANVIIQSGRIPHSANFEDHKYLKSGTPGIVFCSYTHVATNNLRNNLPDELKGNCITIHKLIEYQPVWYEVQAADGTFQNKMKFEETRNESRPLPRDIKVIVFEESSMIDVELYNKVRRALPHHVQFIMLGDIQQLMPVFGAPTLGFKMAEYPLITLTEIYRQAADSQIIKLAYRILEGKPIQVAELESFNGNGLGIFPAKHAITDPEIAEQHLGKFYCQAIDAGLYDPAQDMILCPFNKAPGGIGINKYIANHLARKRGAVVWEVLAGFESKYFAVGDKVFADRKD
jgi:ATP-dependent exoDNAse (exonuclease V) alpha subunit